MDEQLIARLRRETPGVNHCIHLNNAGASLMPQRVIDALRGQIEREVYQGGYEAAAAIGPEVRAFYELTGRLINSPARNIAYAASATDAYSRALSAIPFRRGDVIVTTPDDYVSNHLAFMQLRDRFGVTTVRSRTLPSGGADPDDLLRLVEQHRPRLLAVTHVPTSSGLVQPVAEIGRRCRRYDTIYLVDACQSAGQLPLDVEALHCDFLTATFRKYLRGPRGAGFLYASDRILSQGLTPLFVDLKSARWTGDETFEPAADARRFELWERPYALVMAAKAAVEYALEIGLPTIEKRVKQLANLTRQRLEEQPGWRVLDRGDERCGIVTVYLPKGQPQKVLQALRSQGVHTSLTLLESARYDFNDKGVDWALRASPHYYNTESEIHRFVATLREVIGEKV